METKKNEIIISTSNPHEMVGKFTAERVLRGWKENFVDEDNGEVVEIKRSEVILDKGVLLENETISSLMFYIQSGDIEEVKVSNQRREGVFITSGHVTIWNAIVETGNKKAKLLLCSDSFETATEVVKDYVELNYSGYCKLTQLKEYGDFIIIEDSLTSEDSEYENEKKLYRMDVNVLHEEIIQTKAFLLFATDAEVAMSSINHWIAKNEDVTEFSTSMVSAVTVSFDAIIDIALSQEYMNQKNKED